MPDRSVTSILDWPEAAFIFGRYLDCWGNDLPLIWAKKAWAACARNGLLLHTSKDDAGSAKIVPVILSLFYYEFAHRTGWHTHRNFRHWDDKTLTQLKTDLLDYWNSNIDLIHSVKKANFDHLGDYGQAAVLWISCLESSQGFAYSKMQRDKAYSKLLSGEWDDFNYQRGKSFVVGGLWDDLDTYESISGLRFAPEIDEDNGNANSVSILARIADKECQRIANKVIRHLQSLKDGCLLSGEDSGLENAWDEICVQVQEEHSFYWDEYLLTIRQAVDGAIMGMSPEIAEAIWMQTDHIDDVEPGYAAPVCTDEIVDYIVAEYILAKAGDWSNARIRDYLEWS